MGIPEKVLKRPLSITRCRGLCLQRPANHIHRVMTEAAMRVDPSCGLVTGTGDFVNVLISNSLNGHASEKRFARGITVGDLKGKLELITGANSATMEIFVHDEKRGGALVCALSDDLSKVEKFELSQEQYAKR